MWYVYVLRSTILGEHIYTGITQDLQQRLAHHNSGASPHTSKYRPWAIEVAVRFANEARARAFERYLKTGSGRAFARRHFL
jgi:predicted GIY-YIG superfamily endonuclease